jgi:hypothetical protein
VGADVRKDIVSTTPGGNGGRDLALTLMVVTPRTDDNNDDDTETIDGVSTK